MTFGGQGVYSSDRQDGAGRGRSPRRARASTRASTSSTRPTPTRWGSPSRSSARRSARAARTSCSRRRCAAASAKGPNDVGLSRGHILDGIDASLQPPRHRLRRPVPDPRLRRGHAVGRDAARARRRRARGEGPVPRRLEPRGLAAHEGARHQRARSPGALRDDPVLLLDRGPRPRARARARSWSRRAWACSCGARSRAASWAASSRATRRSPARRAARSSTSRPSTRRAATPCSTCSPRSAREQGVSVARLALAWLLHQPVTTSVIVGARDRRAAARQPGRARGPAHGRPARAPRQGQRAAPGVPGLDGRAPGARPPRGDLPREALRAAEVSGGDYAACSCPAGAGS